MNFLAATKEYLSDFINLIFPKICINCGTILIYQEQHICTRCRLSLPKTNFHTRKDNIIEQKFVYEPKVRAVAAYIYFNKGGIAQKMIHELKYRGQSEIGVLIGKWYGNDLRKANWTIDAIIPVPLHPAKQRKRGYNQSEKIAEGLSEMLETPVQANIITRTRQTSTQTRKTKVQRWQNMDLVYRVTNPEELKDKSVLIVDDVLTTGATIGELIAELTKYEVKSIYIAVIAAG